MRLSNQAVLASSRRYLDLIGGKRMSEPEMHAFIGETVSCYEKHVNRGFITYRKSVTEAGHFAALEWSGHGSIVTDLMGANTSTASAGMEFSARASIIRASSKR